jgi:hypothetical protein
MMTFAYSSQLHLFNRFSAHKCDKSNGEGEETAFSLQSYKKTIR